MSARFPSSVATQLQLLTAQNNSMVVLDADCDLDDDVITIDDASALPTAGYLTFVDTDEVIYYTAKTSNTLTGVIRGADNTSAISHLAGVDLEQRWNADYHNIVTLELIAVEQNLSDRIGLSATQLLVPSGNVGAPSYSHASDTGTGAYFSGASTIDFASNGTRVATFNSTLQFLVYKTTNQLVLGTTNTVTISATAPASSRVLTIPDAGGAANFLLSGWGQIVNADVNASAAIAMSKLSLSITDTQVNASAAIAHSKMAALTVSRALVSDGSGIVSVATTTATEIGYVNGVTSAIQTQLNAKQASGNYITALTGDVTASGPGSVAATIAATTVTGKLITGFSSGSGTVSASDTILQALNKLDGNDGLKLALAGGSVTGDITMTNQKAIIFREASGGGTDSVTVKAASAIATSWTLILPAAGPTANLQVLRVKDYTTGELEFGTGGGSGGINYLSTNPDAEAGTSGWATYADAAGTVPVDGTGGSPSSTLTRNTSSPLRGVGMFTLTKSANNRQGEGASYDFTIDAADKATVLQISFDYQVASGFAAGDSSDVRMFVYDVTNAILITPAPFTIQGGNGVPHKFVSTFQSASNSTSYRLIFHIATSSATAWTMDFDNVIVGPQKSAWGAPISDWVAYTPVWTNATTSNVSGFWRRVGDSMECLVSATLSANLGGQVSVALPTGYSVDLTKLKFPNITENLGLVTSARTNSPTNGNGSVGLKAVGGGAITEVQFIGANSVGLWSNTIPGTWVTSDVIVARFTVPITGWGSNVLMSNDADTRVIAAHYHGTDGATVGTSQAVVKFATKDLDTHGAFSTSTGLYTCPVSGVYRVQAMGGLAVNNSTVGHGTGFHLWKNGAEVCILGTYQSTVNSVSVTHFVKGESLVSCNAGDTLAVYVSRDSGITSYTLATSSDVTTYINIDRISGPATIATTEYIAAAYNTTAGNSVINYAGSPILVDYATKEFDTHNCVTTGASWKFTCPIAGKYRVYGGCSTSSQTWAAGSLLVLYACKNGVIAKEIGYAVAEASYTGRLKTGGGCALIQCNAGDYIDFRIVQNGGATVTLEADTSLNYVMVERAGN